MRGIEAFELSLRLTYQVTRAAGGSATPTSLDAPIFP